MKVAIQVTCLTAYENDELVSASVIRDEGDDVHVVYQRRLMPNLNEFAAAVVKLYANSPNDVGRAVAAYMKGQEEIVLDGYAGEMPCIGNIRVEVQTKEFFLE